MITVQRKLAWQLQIAYLEIFRRFIWLLRKAQFFGSCAWYNYFATAHLPIICLLQINQLLHKLKSSKYFVSMHWKIVWQFQITYLDTFRLFIWLLRKALFLGYCASIILLLRISQLFIYSKSTNYFTTRNRLNISLLCIEKLYENLKSPIWKQFEDLYGYCAKPNALAIAHHTIILLVRMSQLFVYCKSTNYFTTANRLNIWLLCIEKLYDNLKSPIWKHFNDLYGYCTKDNFLGTAHLSFCYCASTNYLSTANRPIISAQEIV